MRKSVSMNLSMIISITKIPMSLIAEIMKIQNCHSIANLKKTANRLSNSKYKSIRSI